MHDVSDEFDETFAWPVIVEYTERHVVWVPAPSSDAARKYVDGAPYDYTQPHTTLYDGDWEVRTPTYDWEWQDVTYGSHGGTYPYQGTDADAHVKTHLRHLDEVQRAVRKAACAAAGHTDTKTHRDGQRDCPVCGYLPALPTEAATANELTQNTN